MESKCIEIKGTKITTLGNFTFPRDIRYFYTSFNEEMKKREQSIVREYGFNLQFLGKDISSICNDIYETLSRFCSESIQNLETKPAKIKKLQEYRKSYEHVRSWIEKLEKYSSLEIGKIRKIIFDPHLLNFTGMNLSESIIQFILVRECYQYCNSLDLIKRNLPRDRQDLARKILDLTLVENKLSGRSNQILKSTGKNTPKKTKKEIVTELLNILYDSEREKMKPCYTEKVEAFDYLNEIYKHGYWQVKDEYPVTDPGFKNPIIVGGGSSGAKIRGLD